MAPRGSAEGNTKAPARVPASKNWFLTWNNYPEEQVAPFIELCRGLCEKFVVEREIGESGTPHLQGKMTLKKKGRPIELFNCISNKIHWEKSAVWKGHEYCAKDSLTTDIDVNIWFGGFEPVLAPKIWGWQQDLVDRIPNMQERKIYWYWEPDGKVGKTDLCRYLVIKHKALVVGGKATDMKCAIASLKEKPRIILVNIVRDGTVSYGGLEAVSDGLFFSPKYESGMVIFNKPKIIVFSNEEPDTERWSKDRYDVCKITIPRSEDN